MKVDRNPCWRVASSIGSSPCTPSPTSRRKAGRPSTASGYRGFWMGYFAARSAPLGVVPPEVVTAPFYNFAPSRVAKALPAAWEIAPPGAALRAREDSAVAALRRYGVDRRRRVRTAAELARRRRTAAPAGRQAAVRRQRGAALAGRTAGQAVARGHAASRTARRRHSGGAGGVGVIAAASPTCCTAAAGRVPAEMIMRSRDYDDDQWQPVSPTAGRARPARRATAR